MTEKRTLWLLSGLFLVSFLARAAFLLIVWGVDAALQGDELAYHGFASSFVDGDGWQYGDGKSSRVPLLPAQLAAIYSIAGPVTGLARWYMVLVSASIAPLLFLLARSLCPGRWYVALLAGMAWALYPPAIWYGSQLLTETMAALLVVSGLWVFVSAARSGSLWLAALTGIIWGLSVMNRSSFLLLPLAMLLVHLLLWKVRSKTGWKPRQWSVALIAVVMVLLPWTVRNAVIHGVFLPTESRAGYALLVTNVDLEHPQIRSGRYTKDLGDLTPIIAQGESEVDQDAIMRRLALDEIKENWHLLPRIILNRAKNFWTTRPDPYDDDWTFNDSVMLPIWGGVLVFSLTSPFMRSWRRNWPALTVVGYVFLLTLPFWGTPRFRFPVDPIMITAATVGFVEFARAATTFVGHRVESIRVEPTA